MKKLIAVMTAVALVAGCASDTTDIVVPTQQQIEWADCELGVMFHYDMQVYNPDYEWREWGTHPDASTYNPSELDTDQWIEAATKMGAKYAVLVAKHCCGFSLWPTDAHEYSIKNSPWKNGEGDIVQDFVESCRKYGVKPGIYASTSANGYYWVDNPGTVQPGSPFTQDEYNEVVTKQLTELWSNYGDLFEIWFDGGTLATEKGGVDVLALARKYQPGTIAFQGPEGMTNLLRWVGNEGGMAPYPCWATTYSTTAADGTEEYNNMNGSPSGTIWCPGESDCTLRHNWTRQGGWMWAPGEDDEIFTADELVKKYETSVGHNSNMLLGLVVDPRGLVPEGDVVRLEEFGKAVEAKYGNPLKTVSGKGSEFVISFKEPVSIDRAVIQEDIKYGERVLEYTLIGLNEKGEWVELASGSNIGHKHIDTFDSCACTKVKLEVKDCKAKPIIKNFAVYESL